MGQRGAAQRTIREHIELAGGNPSKPTLAIRSPFQGQRLAVPRDVRLGDTPEGEPAILWNVPRWVSKDIKSPDYARTDWDIGAPADKALWAFLKLASEPDPEQFVMFARRFGPLGLWPYRTEKDKKIFGLDYWVPSVLDGVMTPHRYKGKLADNDIRSLKASGLFSICYEPVAEWQQWARWFRAVLLIAAELRSGRLASRELWAMLGIPDDLYTKRYRTLRRQQDRLSNVIQHKFLKWSGLTPVIRWTGARPSLELAFGGDNAVKVRRYSIMHDWPENALFPALVASLLAVITAGTPVAPCSMCGELHQRERKPRADQPAYCVDCRQKAIRANKRRSASKRRAREAAATPNLDANLTPKPANMRERKRPAESENC